MDYLDTLQPLTEEDEAWIATATQEADELPLPASVCARAA